MNLDYVCIWPLCIWPPFTRMKILVKRTLCGLYSVLHAFLHIQIPLPSLAEANSLPAQSREPLLVILLAPCPIIFVILFSQSYLVWKDNPALNLPPIRETQSAPNIVQHSKSRFFTTTYNSVFNARPLGKLCETVSALDLKGNFKK